MKAVKSSSVLCIALCASILTGCASSIARKPLPMAPIPAHLKVPPPELPKVQRGAEGMDGGQCFGSLTDLYDVAGGIRSGFIALQQAVLAAERGSTSVKDK